MNTKQVKDILRQIEALKTPETSVDFQAGVDAAHAVVSAIVQEVKDRERIRKLEEELTQLRAKYPDSGATLQKKRGRKPKTTTPENAEFETVTGA